MFTSLKTLVCLAALASASAARDITILYPTAGDDLKAGSSIDVNIAASALLSGSTELGFAIGIVSCPGSCPSINDNLGTVLFTGTVLQSGNYSVALPNWYQGPAQLGVIDAALDGPYAVPTWATATVAVDIYGASG